MEAIALHGLTTFCGFHPLELSTHPIGVFPAVDAFSERQTLNKNRWRCSLVRRGRSAARGRTVRDLVQEHGFPA